MKKGNLKYVWGIAIFAVLMLVGWLVPMPQSWKNLSFFLGIVAGAYLCITPSDSLFSFEKLKAEPRGRRVLDICMSIFALAALAAACYFMFFSPLDPKKNIRYTIGTLCLTLAVLVLVAYIGKKEGPHDGKGRKSLYR
jgi:hypothetical protein